MADQNVTRERFCPRAESWVATWGVAERPRDRCAECGERVIDNTDDDARPASLTLA